MSATHPPRENLPEPKKLPAFFDSGQSRFKSLRHHGDGECQFNNFQPKNIKKINFVAINFKQPVARLVSIFSPTFMRASSWRIGAAGILLLAFGLAGVSTHVAAQTGSKISSTKHNLSRNGPGSVEATSETQVCVFCHTPHNFNVSAAAPLWNRAANPQSYTRYTSSSLDANVIANGFSLQPGGSSQLCLSCHDGMVALGTVNVLPRGTGTPAGGPIAGLTGTIGSYAAAGGLTGSTTGFTRHIGTDLSNDHPISITYNDTLATADGEMFSPGAGPRIAIRTLTVKPDLPLQPTGAGGAGQVQCTTCHDPHLNKDRFLRLNRFQTVTPAGGTFIPASDQICLGCHTKLGTAWSNSVHANSTTANVVYKDVASALRGFPNGKFVWEVGCLNCHDTHTVSGSRRLLREGAGAGPMLSASAPQPGSPANSTLNLVSSIENTCYQCHNTQPNSILGATGTTNLAALAATTGVPDIYSEFQRTVRMPIRTADQSGGTNVETHDIGNANFIECRKLLGNTTGLELAGTHLTAAQKTACDALTGSNDNRHVECTDCHNPHRVIKDSLFNGLGTLQSGLPGKQRTHVAGGTAANLGADGNIASGTLRGTWGVEPSYTTVGQTTVTAATIWPELPTFGVNSVKHGDPGASVSTARTESYLTREYQLCFKCHSNYANSDVAANYPALGNTGGGTPTATNGMVRYTNVAAEFAVRATDPPSTGTDQGEGTNGDGTNSLTSTVCVGGVDCVPAGTTWDTLTPLASTLNHRSWHPVVFPTGRNGIERGNAAFDNIRPPFNVAARIGRQTMHCSDCHGQATSWTDGTGPNLLQAQGPQGSANNFLLKGGWGTGTVLGDLAANTTDVCANCHIGTSSTQSGYNGGHDSGGNMSGSRCTRCHIAVPHGWKNKAFLVNKRCVGTEGGQVTNCVALTNAFTTDLNVAPYYFGARLYFATWRRSRDTGYGSQTTTCSGSGDMTNCTIP